MMKFKTRKIPLIQQKLAIQESFLCSEEIRIEKNFLTWIGSIQPTPLSETYRVKIVYELGFSPHVWVLEPQLQRRNGEKVPHMYMQERLCLHYPGDGTWRSDKLIAGTIIPWISEWLYFYEMWHVTGQWHGGGIHPTSTKKEVKIED